MLRILQKFLLDYTTDWPVLKPSTKGATFCYCCTRRLDFSIGHGGCDDCKRQVSQRICRICEGHTLQSVQCSSRRKLPLQSVQCSSRRKLPLQSVQCSSRRKLPLQSVQCSSRRKLSLCSTRVEALLVTTLMDSNLPLSAADKLTKTLKEMFPDSEITRGLQRGRSKATAMLQELAADSKTTLAQ